MSWPQPDFDPTTLSIQQRPRQAWTSCILTSYIPMPVFLDIIIKTKLKISSCLRISQEYIYSQARIRRGGHRGSLSPAQIRIFWGRGVKISSKIRNNIRKAVKFLWKNFSCWGEIFLAISDAGPNSWHEFRAFFDDEVVTQCYLNTIFSPIFFTVKQLTVLVFKIKDYTLKHLS